MVEEAVLEKAKTLVEKISALLGVQPSFYLYGSVALDDYRPGWSDIDFLCLTPAPVSEADAEKLVTLRQALQEQYGDPEYRSFEGAVLWEKAFWSQTPCTTVYWGTSGQRVQAHYTMDCFSRYELLTSGILLCGEDHRSCWQLPDRAKLYDGVRFHYETIRLHASDTGESLYSCGWLLDIARCLYTLRTGEVIAKTAAGEWALQLGLCPSPESLEKALEIRRNPALFFTDENCRRWCGALGPVIQEFADVLERELNLVQ